ncbi:hypothetical protein A2841_04045 [Candidatus Kaiserbacteria bacterium RIFCSPHIGHO2_01_FULL_48_10]|uniref:DUF1761 domain-containing protein n=1 Tax=Candidatus Kaiserbacteria bacterium RIFCSPHIGHO2_01_FULL_48_10 TaxID=1798476 RepID=A0A1F6C4M1_9BACT|nr:MAG: hypothetical protein A2841_04045 [Candidatus Kaiserbacteria bacterium RIFCSPHIGHO2_01_FULL_48_10]
MEITINYYAVIAAALANMVIGFLWYGPVFGKYWKGLMGFTDESMKAMKMTPLMAMVGGLITALIMAYVLAHFATVFGAAIDTASVMGALTLAFWVWLGFTATTIAGSFLWEGKPVTLFVLNAAQSLVSLSAMALVLALWPW